jgi:hypothetical protein
MPRYAKVMIGFGVFLAVCGFLGWALTGFEARAKTAILSGGITGATMIAMGFVSASPSHKLKMIGIHLGMVLPLVFGGVFVWRASVGWKAVAAGMPKVGTSVLISLMAVASFVTLATILKMRPKKEDRGAPAGVASA